MKIFLLTFYVLIWPAMAAVVLAVLTHGVWKDLRRAQRRGEQLV